MGASTGNLLVDDNDALEQIFAESPVLIVTHCEDCRQQVIDHDRKDNGRYHDGVGPSQKLKKKSLSTYTLACAVCRESCQLVLWKNHVVFMP